MENKNDISPTCIITEAKPGSELFRCIRDAIALAATEKTSVVMRHNDKDYTVDIKTIVDDIHKAAKGI